MGTLQVFDRIVDDPPDEGEEAGEGDDLVENPADPRIVDERGPCRLAVPDRFLRRHSDSLPDEPGGGNRLPVVRLDKRIGSAYCGPPFVQRALMPREIFSGEPAPMLRSKISP